MGFDTYLQVDGETVLMWRKHASALPRVLFQFEDLEIGPSPPDDSDEDDPLLGVSFRTSVGAARRNLEQSGLGWKAAVAAYAEVRFDGYSSGFAMVRGLNEGSGRAQRVEEAEKRLAAFESLSAEVDLVNLADLMVAEWQDENCAEVTVLGDLTYDGDLSRGPSHVLAVAQRAEERKIDEPYAAARAVESLALLDRTAPMLAWPLIVCVFLNGLPEAAEIEFVLTEDASQTDANDNPQSAREYAAAYWSDSSEYLATEARTLERLFAVLAGSGASAGREFWFARAADLLGRVEALRTAKGITNRARGDALESLVDAVVRTEEPELQVLEKNLRNKEEEIDLLLTNGLKDPFWASLNSPLILVECKNWSKKVGVPELRVFETKMRDRNALCRVGFFVSLSGFTSAFTSRLRTAQSDIGVIFPIDGTDLAGMVATKKRLTDWLREEGLRRSLGKRS
jgi:hypothetical protein